MDQWPTTFPPLPEVARLTDDQLMITFPPLPGAARLTDDQWAGLEAAVRCEIPSHARAQIDCAIALFKQREWKRHSYSAEMRRKVQREARQLRAKAKRVARLASEFDSGAG